MRKRKVVKIDDKEFTIKELTVKDIIELVQESYFFGSKSLEDTDDGSKEDAKANKGSERVSDFESFFSDLESLMNRGCDFTIDDIKALAPSEIRELYDAFNEVNKDFLSSLKVLGVSEILINIKDAALKNFSKLFATSLNPGM